MGSKLWDKEAARRAPGNEGRVPLEQARAAARSPEKTQFSKHSSFGTWSRNPVEIKPLQNKGLGQKYVCHHFLCYWKCVQHGLQPCCVQLAWAAGLGGTQIAPASEVVRSVRFSHATVSS